MNELRAPEILSQRYNTHFVGLVRKVSRPVFGTPCCYSNNLACHPVKDMRGALKVKLQNALNQAILGSAEDRGIFVGGRRRNRKRRRNRNGRSQVYV
ncbi:hypothetical protein FSP39_021999 [Pinctada imbricata]|uniref:Uncharacterized protein n=1 Tax=Pinctada imbricata TaxID=66713 RepID=A0AA88Y9H7_PINIB|nr:hypothetical protein FSP39_021999 [Pinctada imbricata]